jgi:NitT/TauT family transport system substrate-binding protein
MQLVRTRRSRSRAATAAAIALALGMLALPAMAKQTINVGMVVAWPGYSFYALAQEKNLAPDYDIKVVNLEDPLAAQGMLASGKLDVLAGTLDYIPIAIEQNLPIVNVAYTNPSYGVDQIALAPGVETSQLTGHKIAAPEAYIGKLLMGVWLDKVGVAPSDVEWVNLNADEALGPMLSGDLAAAYMYEPWISKLTANLDGARSVANTSQPYFLKLGIFGDSIYMNSNFIRDHRQAALDMLRVRWKALQYWHDHTGEANAFIADFLQWPVADVESVIGTNGKYQDGGNYMLDFDQSARFCGVEDGEPPLGLKNGGFPDSVKLINKWWVKFGLVKKMHDPEAGIDCSLMGDLVKSGFSQHMEAGK